MKTQKIRTKLMSLLLAAIMVLSLLPVSALADKVDNGFAPGTYTGTAQGFGGDVSVSVTLAEQDGSVVISDITAEGAKETPKYWTKAVALLNSIKAANGTDGIDAKCGATKSATGIINATNAALRKAVSGFTSGTGTQNDPYIISSEAGLRYLQAQVAAGNSYKGQYIKLGADIALSGEWTPIGSSSDKAFAGTFDGAGHTVSGMTITGNTLQYVGLFGYTLNGVVIKNVRLTDVNINMTEVGKSVYAGALVGFIKVDTNTTASSVLDNCFASGSITVKTADKVTVVGGLAGFTDQRAAVTNCGTNVEINTDSGMGRATVGGLVAWASIRTLFENDYTLGNVTVATENDTYANVGGMFGQVNGILYNLCSAGVVTLKTSVEIHKAGSIAGDLAAASYADGCYYSGGSAFGKEGGKYNAETVADKSDIMGTQAFADILHNNLAPAAVEIMAANVAAANITGCGDFGAMTARVNDRFYDWTISNGTVVLDSALWSSADVDASIFASGDGTEENPYVIKTAEQLRAFADSMNDKIDYTGKFVALAADIDASGAEWSPIGGSEYAFNGTFNGRGHTVSGLRLGTEEAPFALDSENLYIGLFGVLGNGAYVKNVNVSVAFYAKYEASAYVGGIAGYADGNRTNGNFTGAVIDGCNVTGTIKHVGDKGNQFVGGIVGMQYKGAVINSSSEIKAFCIVKSGDLAEVGGLVGLNNRGLVANCRSDSNVYGSGNRENGNEGMAVVSSLVACNAGSLVNCYAAGSVETEEHSVYAGMVSGWVTGIGKSYNCLFDLNSTMTLKVGDKNPQPVKPVESIGTKVASGVNDEGDAFTGGLVDKMTGVNGASNEAANTLNASFAAFPIDITVYGIENNSLKQWTFDNVFGFGDAASVTYVQPECEKIVKPELKLNDGVWYGRDNDKKSVVKITVKDNAITETVVVSGEGSGEAYDAALEKAKNKAIYGDFSNYEAADPNKFGGGSGTAEDPYLISNEAQLRYLSSSINADVSWKNVYFKQTADITLNGQWQPIGWALNGEVNGKKTQICAYPFRGNYDGGGYSISGLTIGSKDAPADQMTSGLFGLTSGEYTTNNTPDGSEQTVTLKNINLKDISINVKTRYETYTGGLVGSGQNGIYIDNCTVTGEISAETSESFCRVGGLAASVLRGAVINCGTDVEISGITDTNHVYAGGLYGMDNRVTTFNCYALGNVTGNSTNNNKVHLGGIVGQAGGIHYNCYAAGDVISLKSTSDAGALNGRSAGINIDYYCYYNTDAVVKQGDIQENKAIGVVTINAFVEGVAGKTAAELKSADFAALLNENASAEKAAAANEAINKALDENGSGLAQANYYNGTKLLTWSAESGRVVFGANAPDDKPVVPVHRHTVVTDPAVEPTCTATGLTEGKHCSTCNAIIVKQETVPALGHKIELKNDKAASCTEDGYTGDEVCTVCGETVKKGETVKAAGHKTELKNTKAASCTENGYTGDEVCTVCGETVKKGEAVKAAGHDYVNGLCTVCGEKDPSYNPFKDVKHNAYYDAILWANANGITNGKTEDTFAPDDGCTRAQIVTFLYRAAGSPEVKNVKNPFTDVSESSVYYKAIMWAVENGITKGTTDTTFSPNAVCTRAQIVVFLYRASGDDASNLKLQFTDVPANAWCAEAVAWAVSKGITNGTTATTFSPNATCTRAQAVTFIYRAQ